VLHISIWGVEAFFGGLSGDGTEIWAPMTTWAQPNWRVWSAADMALYTQPTLTVEKHFNNTPTAVSFTHHNAGSSSLRKMKAF